MPIVEEDGVIGGVPHIQGHRIAVHHIVNHVLFGPHSVKDVARDVYPELSEKEVLEAIRFACEDTERWKRLMDDLEREQQGIAEQAITPDDVVEN